jgi:DinB superfamily
MASERSSALADDFVAANAEVVAFAASCDDDAWVLPVPGEGWTVGVVVHHIAEGHANALRWLEAMARGDGVSDTAEGIDQANALHARRAGGVTQAETVALLEENGARLGALLRSLSDGELDRAAPFGPAGGRDLRTGALAAVAARHAREHLAHARTATGQGA